MAHRVAAWKLGLKNSSPLTFHDTVLQPGMRVGQFFEDYQGNGVQLFQLVDGTAVAGDVLYYKSYTGGYPAVTPTIGNSSAGEVAGTATATLAVGEYCAVQKKGVFPVKANGIFARGYPVWADSGNNRVIPGGVFGGALATVATAGGIFAVANPCTGAWLVTDLFINRTTKSTGAATLDAGIAADAVTLSDTLIDGLNLNATEANNENQWVNGGGDTAFLANAGAAGTVLTGSSVGAASVAGLVGTYSGRFRQIGATVFNSKSLGIAQGAVSGGKVSMLLDLPYFG